MRPPRRALGQPPARWQTEPDHRRRGALPLRRRLARRVARPRRGRRRGTSGAPAAQPIHRRGDPAGRVAVPARARARAQDRLLAQPHSRRLHRREPRPARHGRRAEGVRRRVLLRGHGPAPRRGRPGRRGLRRPRLGLLPGEGRRGARAPRLHLTRRRRRVYRRAPPIEVGPLPKLPIGADAFPPPYDVIEQHTDAKNLVLCDGELYQVWRRPSGAGSVTVDAPPGGTARRVHVFEGAVFVLRYDPGNWPGSSCWTVAGAKDLRGNAVFVGMNAAAVVRGEGVSANSVYYWDGPRGGGDYGAMVYNVATGASVRWPAAPTGGGVSSPVWYFLPAGDGSPRVEEETTGVEATSGEETTSLEHDEEEHSAHCLKKTMNLLGRLDYSIVYGSRCEAGEN
ncbi:uncharacterized protein LOC120640196 [Panicum virgatum]|uniref:uncharacterized protein LOC120640196 n=1 Tax=Panicum virgatum TaxID=38727 RepID=UPI0019D559BA|nr:uncharacterized protein LOC120640196 [Panicum virgatum]